MPGMAVILTEPNRPPADMAAALGCMIGALTYAGHQTATLVDERLGLAAAHTAPRHTGGAVGASAGQGAFAALVEGEPIGLPDRGESDDASRAGRLAVLYAASGVGGLERLRGHWAAVIVDRAQGAVIVANDPLGIRPLYRMRTGDGWLLATNPAAILAHLGARREVSPAGLADYLAFGYPLGRHTLFEGMERLPGATVLTFGAGGPAERRYWLPAMKQEPGWSQADLEAMRCRFNEHVLETVAQGGPASLALSGGGDSRAILSALVAGGQPLDTLTHAVAAATDARIGRELARVAGSTFHFYETCGEDILPHVAEGVRMVGGQAAGIEVHPLAFLPEYPTFTRAMLTGLGGNLYKGNFLTGEPESRHTSLPELAKWVTARQNYLVHTYNDFEPLLTGEWYAELRSQPERSVTEVLEAMNPETAVCRRSVVFYLQERASKYLVKGDSFVRREIEARHPFMDRDLLVQGWRFPSKARARNIIPSYIITRNAPQLLDVEVTYAAGSGWPLRRYSPVAFGRVTGRLINYWETLRERRQERLPTVPNYRYGEWLRGALRPLVEQVLLDPRTLSRPYFRPETVRRWIEEHMAGQKRADKLSALLSLELTLRAFVDAPPAPPSRT